MQKFKDFLRFTALGIIILFFAVIIFIVATIDDWYIDFKRKGGFHVWIKRLRRSKKVYRKGYFD